jgi:UTP--glucose-1-phosphate uridylyltransferase
MAKITKAVIPVAGYGTRFLPATKALPKEMLPIIDKPVVQFIVEEAVASGITDIILVTGASKRAVEDHFDYNLELERWLDKNKKEEELNKIRKIAELANFIHIRQKGPYGNGTPVLNAKHLIGHEPFCVMWGDDMFLGQKPALAQMIKVFEKYGDPVLTALEVSDEGTEKYGILDVVEVEKDIFQVKSIVEKPGPKKAPSHFASVGRYVLTPDIFEALETIPLGKGGERWLVDALFQLSKKRPIYAKKIEGKYYDLGSKIGWLKANVEMGLEHSEVKKDFKNYLKRLKLTNL